MIYLMVLLAVFAYIAGLLTFFIHVRKKREKFICGIREVLNEYDTMPVLCDPCPETCGTQRPNECLIIRNIEKHVARIKHKLLKEL